MLGPNYGVAPPVLSQNAYLSNPNLHGGDSGNISKVASNLNSNREANTKNQLQPNKMKNAPNMPNQMTRVYQTIQQPQIKSDRWVSTGTNKPVQTLTQHQGIL